MPLLDEDTCTKFGYRIGELNPASAKPVIYACDGPCGKTFERQRRRANEPPFLCHSCKIHQPRPVTAVAKFKATMRERYGVDHALQHPSIYAAMEERNHQKYGVKNVSELPGVKEKQRNWWTRRNGETPLVNGVLVDETVRRFGYRPQDLAPRTDRLITCQCSRCLAIFDRVAKNIAHPLLCHRCS